jgi:hypothetical protein
MSQNPVPPRLPPKLDVVAKPQIRTASAAEVSDAATGDTGPQQAVTIAKAATYYRTTRYIMVVLLIGMGGWFGYDGFKGWPSENPRIDEVNQQLAAAQKAGNKELVEKLNADPLARRAKHSDMDILFQKLLAFALPTLGLGMLAWALYNSRGEYRLEGEVLSVPGHPVVALNSIYEIDKQLWDRKGIAYVAYTTAKGKAKLRLDDFIYDREPTDQIYDRLAAYVSGHHAG